MLNLGRPQIDVATRWNSTYIMLQKLISYKEMCTDHLKDPLSDSEWIEVENLEATLKPAYILTMKLQEEQLPLGDFFKAWLTLEVVLKKESEISAMAGDFLKCIERRESEIVNNDIMISALFLDPRFRRVLTLEQKSKAKQYLKYLANQIIKLKQVIWIVYLLRIK